MGTQTHQGVTYGFQLSKEGFYDDEPFDIWDAVEDDYPLLELFIVGDYWFNDAQPSIIGVKEQTVESFINTALSLDGILGKDISPEALQQLDALTRRLNLPQSYGWFQWGYSG